MAEIVDQLRVLVEQVIALLGYPGITLLMLVENIFPPIPSEVVLPFAGFLVARGEFTLWGIILAGTLGSVLGALVLYYIGVWADEPVVRGLIRRYGRLLQVSEADLDRSLEWFERYGQAVVFFGRVVPLVRSLVSIPAGIHRMPLPSFLFFTTAGSAIWSGVLAYAGMVLGANWESVLGFIENYQTVTLAVLALLALLFVFKVMLPRARSSES